MAGHNPDESEGGQDDRGVAGAGAQDGEPEHVAGGQEDPGGKGIAVRCDFLFIADVDALRAQIEAESGGRIDLLADDVWGGDPFVDFATLTGNLTCRRR
jgi:hypothetical protein